MKSCIEALVRHVGFGHGMTKFELWHSNGIAFSSLSFFLVTIFEGLSRRMDVPVFSWRDVAYMQKALLILYLPVDLVPGSKLNLDDGADDTYRYPVMAEFVSIDEVS